MHRFGAADLGNAGREMVVPKQSHLFPQRVPGIQHGVDPPAAERRLIFGFGDRGACLGEQRFVILGFRLTGQQAIDRSLRASFDSLSQFGESAAECGRTDIDGPPSGETTADCRPVARAARPGPGSTRSSEVSDMCRLRKNAMIGKLGVRSVRRAILS